MLNLTRRPHESVIVTCPDGTQIEITVLRVDGASVKFGITAPKSFTVDRFEVHHRKQREATGEPLEGQEPRGSGWIDYRERRGNR